MKKIFLAALLVVSCNVFANGVSPKTNSNKSVYVGATGGFVYDGLNNNLFKEHTTNFAGRAFVGYNFTKHFAVETGYLITDKRDLKFAINDKVIKNFKIKQQIADLTLRVNIPLDESFIAYARGGVTYFQPLDGEKFNKDKINITYGAGLDYKISKNLTAGVSWSHYNGGSKNPVDIIYKKQQPSLDLYGFSVSYKINI